MRFVVLLLCGISCAIPGAEPLRWLAGPGFLGGQPAIAGAAVAMDSLVAAGSEPVLVDLGRSLTGMLVLAPGAQVVASVDGRALIVRVMVGRAQVRLAGPGVCERLRLRNERGEAKLVEGLIQADAGGTLVLVEGKAEVRGVGTEGRGSPWAAMEPRRAMASPGGEAVPVVLRPQMGELPLLDQAEGRRLPAAATATGLDPWQRDDALVQVVHHLLAENKPAGLIALRVVATWEPASALLIQQQGIADAPADAVALTLEVATANPGSAPLAVAGAVLIVPDQHQAIVDAVVTALPHRREAVMDTLYAVFPALAPPPVPAVAPEAPVTAPVQERRSKIDDRGLFLAPNQVHPFFR